MRFFVIFLSLFVFIISGCTPVEAKKVVHLNDSKVDERGCPTDRGVIVTRGKWVTDGEYCVKRYKRTNAVSCQIRQKCCTTTNEADVCYEVTTRKDRYETQRCANRACCSPENDKYNNKNLKEYKHLKSMYDRKLFNCPESFKTEGNYCVRKIEKSKLNITSTSEPSCPDGYVLKIGLLGSRNDPKPDCPGGQVLEGRYCVERIEKNKIIRCFDNSSCRRPWSDMFVPKKHKRYERLKKIYDSGVIEQCPSSVKTEGDYCVIRVKRVELSNSKK